MWPSERMMGTVAAIVVSGACTPPALAQAEEARAVFEAAREAVNEAKDIAYTVTLSGEGSLASSMPKGKVEVLMVRVDEPGTRVPFSVRLDGEAANRADQDTFEMDVLRSAERTVFLDHDKKLLNERAGFGARYDLGTVDTMMILPEMLEAEPYAREMEAESYEILESETIDGEVCDVIKVTYVPGGRTEREPNGLSRRRYGTATWSIAQSDRMPRKVSRSIGAAGLLSVTIIQKFEDVKLNRGLVVEDLEIELPEGYEKRGIVKPASETTTTPAPGPNRPLRNEYLEPEGDDDRDPPTETDAPPAPVAEAQPAEPTRRMAPLFTFETADGQTVTRADLNGRVAVLYFWGSWCSSCVPVSPLVSTIATDHEALPVSVYGIAVRERSLEGPRDAMDRGEYRFTLAVQPGEELGTLNLPTEFRVRSYPTAVVIGPDGRIIGQESLIAAGGAQEMADAIRVHIRDGLAELGDG